MLLAWGPHPLFAYTHLTLQLLTDALSQSFIFDHMNASELQEVALALLVHWNVLLYQPAVTCCCATFRLSMS